MTMHLRFLAGAADLDYRTLLQYLRLPRPSGDTLRWMLVSVIAAILFFIMYEIVARIIRRSTEQRRSEENFQQLTLVCGLTPEEIRLLRHLIGICGIQYPDRLLTSFEFFNRCLEERGPASSGPITRPIAERLRAVRNKVFFGERSRLSPIKSTRELTPNQRLHMKRLSTGQIFMAPVVDSGPTGLLVATPRLDDEYLEVRPGERFEIYFWRERDAGYGFETEALGQSGTRYLITILKHVDHIERTQRRQYHRISVLIPITVVPMLREDLDKISGGEPVYTEQYPSLKAYIVDISGTGFAFASRIALRANDLVHIELEPEGESKTIPLFGKVINVTKREATDEFLMHTEFVGLNADTHEKILQFVYAKAKRGVSGVL
jgi:c-di-GMP-binding flagellar brake protein YcgR